MSQPFLSTPSARRATKKLGRAIVRQFISIHALREEGDRLVRFVQFIGQLFLSTPSARRATPEQEPVPQPKPISIHALREEGDLFGRGGNVALHISIHALREEGDTRTELCQSLIINFYPRPPRGGRLHVAVMDTGLENFYPRPPRGGRHLFILVLLAYCCISIHALREEGDLSFRSSSNSSCRFLSTPSARRATA